MNPNIEDTFEAQDKEIKGISDKMLRYVFQGDFEEGFGRIVWRMSSGVRTKAFEILRRLYSHYFPSVQLTDEQLDCVLGELNGGIEIEWVESAKCDYCGCEDVTNRFTFTQEFGNLCYGCKNQHKHGWLKPKTT